MIDMIVCLSSANGEVESGKHANECFVTGEVIDYINLTMCVCTFVFQRLTKRMSMCKNISMYTSKGKKE